MSYPPFIDDFRLEEIEEKRLLLESKYAKVKPRVIYPKTEVHIPTNLARNLKILRRRRRVTQEWIAKKLGTNRKRYSAWEENRSEPPLFMLIRLSIYHKVTITKLII